MTRLKTLLHKSLSFSSSVHQYLIISGGFSLFLLMLRMAITKELVYSFLIWNLFLAYIPYGITYWLIKQPDFTKIKNRLWVALPVWLLFLPNSFYILTDLFHLAEIDGAPKWFDLLLIFSFAWNALLAGIISIRRVEVILEAIKSRIFSLLAVYLVMWLSAFGVYIGRYLRYNSWDIITEPLPLTVQIIRICLHPIRFGHVWAMTFCYSIFMLLLYFTIKKMNRTLTHQQPGKLAY